MKPKLPLPCLCLVTDRARAASGDLVDTARAAVEGGVGMIQLREKDLPASELLSLARELRSVTEGRALLIVNDRVDVALLSGADGVQLGEKGLDAASARRLVGPDMLIGRSVHSVEGAAEAEADGADFLVLGTIFESLASRSGHGRAGACEGRDRAGRNSGHWHRWHIGVERRRTCGGGRGGRGGDYGYINGAGSEGGGFGAVGGYAAGVFSITLTLALS